MSVLSRWAQETFGARLKRLRERADLTQGQLADRAGLNRFTVSKLERDLFDPTWTVVRCLAKSLGVSCAAFEGTAEPAEKKAPAKIGRPRRAPAADQGEQPQAEAPPAKKRRKPKG